MVVRFLNIISFIRPREKNFQFIQTDFILQFLQFLTAILLIAILLIAILLIAILDLQVKRKAQNVPAQNVPQQGTKRPMQCDTGRHKMCHSTAQKDFRLMCHRTAQNVPQHSTKRLLKMTKG
jgi:flagellar biosynthesis/type III secretory pathway M-ring protein FliF/YscJ